MDSNIQDLLTEAKELIREDITLLSFKTWILPLEISSIYENTITLIAKDQFQKETIETRFKDLISNAFNIILQKNCNIEFVLKDDLQTKDEIVPTFNTPNINFSVNYANTFLNKSYSTI